MRRTLLSKEQLPIQLRHAGKFLHPIEVESTMKKLPNIDTQLLLKFALMLAGLSFLFMQVDGLKELGSVLLALCLLPFIFKLPEDK